MPDIKKSVPHHDKETHKTMIKNNIQRSRTAGAQYSAGKAILLACFLVNPQPEQRFEYSNFTTISHSPIVKMISIQEPTPSFGLYSVTLSHLWQKRFFMSISHKWQREHGVTCQLAD